MKKYSYMLALGLIILHGMIYPMRRSTSMLTAACAMAINPKAAPTAATMAVFNEQRKKYVTGLVRHHYDPEQKITTSRNLKVAELNQEHVQAMLQQEDLRITNEELNQLQNASMEVRYVSPRIGYGVYATEDIPKDTFVAVYAGIVTDAPAIFGLSVRRDMSYDLGYAVDLVGRDMMSGTTVVSGEEYRNEVAYMNHASGAKENMQLVLRVREDGVPLPMLYTTRLVKAGEELRWNYGDEHFVLSKGFMKKLTTRIVLFGGIYYIVKLYDEVTADSAS